MRKKMIFRDPTPEDQILEAIATIHFLERLAPPDEPQNEEYVEEAAYMAVLGLIDLYLENYAVIPDRPPDG